MVQRYSSRVWLVTVRDADGKFIDQRRIESSSQADAESDAYDWIRSKGGDAFKSSVREVE